MFKQLALGLVLVLSVSFIPAVSGATTQALCSDGLPPAYHSDGLCPGEQGDYDNENTLSCVNLSRDLRYRTTGTDVSLLQDFLQTRGLLNSEPTGFFGQMTLNAVRQYQSSVGLSATGFVGPLTRARIKAATCDGVVTPDTGSVRVEVSATPTVLQATGETNVVLRWTGYYADFCTFNTSRAAQRLPSSAGSMQVQVVANDLPLSITCYDLQGRNGRANFNITASGTNSSTFSASPVSGSAPLAVAFTGSTQDTYCSNAVLDLTYQYYVDYGDGQRSAVLTRCASFSLTHTYSSGGTYTPKLMSETYSMNRVTNSTIVRTATVTVSGTSSTNTTMTASPRSGNAPLLVTFTTNLNTPGGSYVVDYGDGTSEALTDCFGVYGTNFCQSPRMNGHTYRTAGTYTAKLFGACIGDSFGCSALPNGGRPLIASATITVTAGTSPQPSGELTARPQSGSAPLTVTFTHSVNNWSTSYTMDYGDGSRERAGNCYAPYDLCLSPGSNTHTYRSAGTYTAKLISSGYADECNGYLCTMSEVTRTVATVTITVTGSGGTSANWDFRPYPTSGTVPLNVTYSFSDGETGTAWIEYGDGSRSSDMSICGPGSICTLSIRQAPQHTYTTAGTYTARLMFVANSDCPSGMVCVRAPQQVGTATIVVSGGTSTNWNFRAFPTTGAAPLNVTYEFADGETGVAWIEYGDGSRSADISTCGSGSICTLSIREAPRHTYTSAGTYTARLIFRGDNGCNDPYAVCALVQPYQVGSVTIVVSGGTTPTPCYSGYGVGCVNPDLYGASIQAYPLTGAAPLYVNFSGSTASGCGGGYFTLRYGDGIESPISIPADSCRPGFNFTHTYNNPGTYVATLINDWNPGVPIASAKIGVR